MKKLSFLILLILCVSCRMNTSTGEKNVEVVDTGIDETENLNHSEEILILETLGKEYGGSDPHISRLTLESPNSPDFIEGFYFDDANLVFQIKGDTVKARQVLEDASGSSKFKLEKIDGNKYSQKELNIICEELNEKFRKLENNSVKRNMSSWGVGSDHVYIKLMVNTPQKRGEFLKEVMYSPAFRFEGREFPVINEMAGVSDTLGISIRPEYPVFSTESYQIKFMLDNQSGSDIIYGDMYFITFEDENGIWREYPRGGIVHAIGYIVENNTQAELKASLYPDIFPGKPGRYRYFNDVRVDGKGILLMVEFRLSPDENELKAAKKTVLPKS